MVLICGSSKDDDYRVNSNGGWHLSTKKWCESSLQREFASEDAVSMNILIHVRTTYQFVHRNMVTETKYGGWHVSTRKLVWKQLAAWICIRTANSIFTYCTDQFPLEGNPESVQQDCHADGEDRRLRRSVRTFLSGSARQRRYHESTRDSVCITSELTIPPRCCSGGTIVPVTAHFGNQFSCRGPA